LTFYKNYFDFFNPSIHCLAIRNRTIFLGRAKANRGRLTYGEGRYDPHTRQEECSKLA
jgi:hypothetical protein